MTSGFSKLRLLANRWKSIIIPSFFTLGAALAVVAIAADAPASGPTAATEAPPITLSDLDGDGDLDLLVDAPLGQAPAQAVDVYANDGNRMTPLASGLAKRDLDTELAELLPGYSRFIAGMEVEKVPTEDQLGQAPLPPLPPGMEELASDPMAAPERFDDSSSSLGEDYPLVRTHTINFAAMSDRVSAANPGPDETVRRHRLLSISKMGGLPEEEFVPEGPSLLGGDFKPGMRDHFLGVIDNHTAIPADTHGAVGPEHLMVALNTEIAVQTREGELLSKVGLSDFWGGFDHGFVFDPKVVYDHLAKRWVLFTIADVNTTKSAVLIGLSKTSNPNGEWDMASIRVHPTSVKTNYLYADYPSVGYNGKWLAASVNMYKGTNEVAGTKEFVGSRIYAFHKPDYIRNDRAFYTQFDDPGYFTVVPATTHDAADTNLLFVTENSTRALRISALSGKVGQEHYTPKFATTPLKDIVPWEFSIGKTNISPQKGTAKNIFGNDSRMHALIKRNGKLWAAHHVFLPEGVTNVNRTAVQWWNLETNATIIQRGYIQDTNGVKQYTFPSIAVNKNNDVLIGYSGFTKDTYASAYYSYRKAADPLGEMSKPALFKSGVAPYVKLRADGRNSWGDYSATQVDPNNDTDMWTIQMYAETRNTDQKGIPDDKRDRWGTWWGHVAFQPDDPPVIVVHPANQTIMQFGSTVELSVQAKGAETLTYQWRFDNKDIEGATQASYTIDNFQPEHMGRYEVVVRNAVGYTRSKTAVLDAVLPSIGSPANVKIIDGSNVTMTTAPTPVETVIGIHTNVVLKVEPKGTGPFAYQWSFNGEAIDGATASSVDIGVMTPATEGAYTVNVRTAIGEANSEPAQLEWLIFDEPEFFNLSLTGEQLGFQVHGHRWTTNVFEYSFDLKNWKTLLKGGEEDLMFNASGKNSKAIDRPSGVNALYVRALLKTEKYSKNAIGYTRVTYPAGKSLIANPLSREDGNTLAKLFTGFPDGTTLAKLDEATGELTVNVFEGGAWENPEMTLDPGEGAVLDLAGENAVTVDYFGVALQGDLASVIPAKAALRSALTPAEGGVASALGLPESEGLQVQLLDNETGAYVTYTFADDAWQPAEPSVALGQAFRVTAVAALEWDQSVAYNAIILPEVTTQPEDQVVTSGSWLGLSVRGVGDPLDYQWFFKGEAIEGATRNALAFEEAAEANAGEYTVRLTNRFGSVTSLPADVAVHYVINRDTTGAGRIVLTPLQDHYAPGTAVTVTGVPDEGYSFASWGGDASGDSAQTTVTVGKHLTVTADFSRDYIMPTLKDAHFRADGTFQFTVVAEPGVKNNIQYSFDLENWVDHSTQTNPGELHVPVIPPAGSVGMYFRVLVTGKGYSDNIVGYHLLEVPTGQSLLSSPLAKVDNTLATLLPSGPANLTVSTWNSEAGEWTASTFGEAWSNAGLTIAPGQAALFDNKTGSAVTLKFTGQVTQGSLSAAIPVGDSYHAATLPLAGEVSTDFELPTAEGLKVSLLNNATGEWTTSTFTDGAWSPTEPGLAAGQGFRVTSLDSLNWSRDINLNSQGTPKIVSQPVGALRIAGQPMTFSVEATGTPLEYQWRFNGMNIDGATSATLQLANVQHANAGDYTVYIRNPFGNILSATAALDVQYTLGVAAEGHGAVTHAPELETYPHKSRVVLNAVPKKGYVFTGWSGAASGVANPLAVTMDTNKSIIGSFTRDVVPPEYRSVKINDAGQLEWVQVGRPGKTLTSDYSLDLLNWQQFTSDSSASGEIRIPFNRPAGINNLFIRTWEEETGYAARALGYVTLTVPAGYSLVANPLSNGGNRVSDIFPSAPSGSTLSKFNAMTGKWEANTFTDAWSQPGMTLAPGEGAVFKNEGAAFDVVLAGFTPWAETTLGIPAGKSVVSPRLAKGGLLSSRLGMPMVDGLKVELLNNATGKYDAYTVSAGAWSPAEPAVALGQAFIVTAPSAIEWTHDPTIPMVTSPPTDLAILSGGKAGFIVKAVGEPLTYQWLFDGKPIAGATASAMQLPVATAANAGRYSVVVSNGFGKTVSPAAQLDIYYTLKLAIEGRGRIELDPKKSAFLAGSKVTLNATPATGYSWMHWSGDEASGDSTFTVTMDAHKTITANFSRDYIMPDLSEAGFDDKGRFTFILTSEPNANCEIQATIDGVRWQKLGSYQNKNGIVRIPLAYSGEVAKQMVRILVPDELAPGRIAGHSQNYVGYINLDIPAGQSLYHVPLVLSGNTTIATLFQNAPKDSTISILNSETGEWAEGTLAETWSNASTELKQGSIFKFTNAGDPFRVILTGAYAGQGGEVSLVDGHFGYPAPLSGVIGNDLQFPTSAPAGTKLGLLQSNGETTWYTFDGASWSPSEPSLGTMQAVQVDVPDEAVAWQTHGAPDHNRKPIVRAITGDGTHLAGTTTLLELDAVGTPMSIQWTKNNEPIPGATQRWLQLANLVPGQAGRYAVTLRNAFGIENSNPVEVNVHYSLTTVVAAGEGAIGVEPSLPTYPPGTEVTLTAKPGEGLGFDNWEGDASGTEESITIVMDGHKTVSIRYLSDNQPPTVAIVSPRAGQFFSAPGDVEISLDASDPDGSITHVIYERKTEGTDEWVALGQADSADGVFTWENAGEGVYEIRATVTDNRLAKAVSEPVKITLTTGNLPPVIVSTYPAEGDFVAVPGKFTFKVVAYDPDGDIKSIAVNRGTFFPAHGPTYWNENDDGHSVLTDTRWETGYYPKSSKVKFIVDVTDNQDKVTTLDVIFTVNHAPTVELTAPAAGAEFVSPATISLTANASDNAADGDMRHVDFFANGELVGRSTKAPYAFTWEGVEAGEYQITAAVTDRHRQTVETEPVTIQVLQGAFVALVQPETNIAVKPGGTTRLEAEVQAGSAAVAKVEFFKNDQLIGTDNEAPYALDWTEAEAGVYQLTAKVTDAKGGTAMTEAVEAAVFDSADYPALGLRLWLDGSTVTQEASKVSAWVDRTPFGHDTSQAEVGQQPAFHSEGINGQPAIVFDGEDDILSGTANGATLLDSTAASLFLVMKQDGGSRNNAVFGWESDSHRNHLDLLFTYNNVLLFDYGNASDGGRISGAQPERWDNNWHLVEVYRDGPTGRVAVGGVTVFEGEFTDDLAVDVDGTLSIGGVGTLHHGGAVAEVLVYNRTLSAEEVATVRNIIANKFDLPVMANQLPTIALTEPVEGTSFKAASTRRLVATASDADGTVTKVQFFADDKLIGEDSETPFESDWTPTTAASVVLTAVATDDREGQSTSDAINVTVLPPNVGPEVVITSPSAGRGVSVGSTLKVSVTASDSDGDVTEVEFVSGDESLAKRSEAPYEVDWRLAKPGLHTLTVKATDNDGAVTEAVVAVAAYGEVPVPVDGLRLWLDAGNGLTTGADGVVSSWADQSHFGHDVGQAELGLQPTLVADAVNGKPALLFDGEDDALARADVAGADLLSADEVSVFAVVRQKWQSKVNTVVAWEAPNYKNHMALLTSYNNKFLIDYGHASEGGRVSANQPEGWDDEWHVLEFVRSGNTAKAQVGSTEIELSEFSDSLEVDALGTLSVGAVPKLAFGGEIAEVLVYNRSLTNPERDGVRGYLGARYGLFVIENELPAVAMTKPEAGTEIKQGNPLLLSAEASDPDGSVARVLFFSSGKNLGVDESAPFELEWIPDSEGEQLLTAVAVDNRGGETISSVVSVTVLPPNVGPEVVITSPSAGKGVSAGSILKVSVTALDSDGDVTEVEFLSGDESLAKRSEAPYEVDWRLAKPGLQSLTVKATDNDGAVTEATVTVAAYGETLVPVDGLRLWLDAGNGLTTGADGVVSGWADQSHFSHDVGQAELGLQPTLVAEALNGKPALLFDGEDDFLARVDVAGADLLSPDEVSVFAVVRQKWQSKVNTIVAWEAPNYKNHMALLTSYNNKFLIDYGHASEGGRVSANQPEGWDDEWHVLEFARAGNLSTVKVDGESVEMGEFGESLEVDALGVLSVGAVPKLAFGGEIAEVLVYNRTLSTGEHKS
ncbi:MAG: Ig-like domain-containing protein, partial [Verrucomicrobiales bacterium]|nr:Ig-like domain-containing protein [Verrucomicrobiales bacterium]